MLNAGVMEAERTLIWYSPDTGKYQVGSEMDYEVQRANSIRPADMTVLYELEETTQRIADKIVKELNSARNEINSY